MKLQHLIIVQNKIDIVIKNEGAAKEQMEQIKKFVAGTIADGAPIIPVSAQLKHNVDVVVDYLTRIPVPIRDFTADPYLIIIRSFDVNRPGEDAEHLKGGVCGGTILKGVLKMGDEVEIRPGIIRKDQKTGKVTCSSIFSQITSLKADENQLMFAVPGGLIGVGLKIDPFLSRSDHLVGHVLGHSERLPEVFFEIDVQFYLLRRLLGVKSEAGSKKN